MIDGYIPFTPPRSSRTILDLMAGQNNIRSLIRIDARMAAEGSLYPVSIRTSEAV